MPRWFRTITPFFLVLARCGGEAASPGDSAAGAGGTAGSQQPTAGAGSGGSVTAGNGGSGSGQSGSANGGAAGTNQPSAGSGGSSGAGSGGAGSGGSGGSAAAGSGTGALAGMGGAAAGVGGGGAGGGAASSAGSAGTAITGMPVEQALEATTSPRQEHAVAAANGEVYVLGGYAPSATASVEAYDPETDSWREVADFVGPFNHANVGVVDDKLYLGGFYEAGSMTEVSPQTFVYDPVEDEWTELSPMPAQTERAAACVAVLGTTLYVFGGSRNNMVVADVSSYDTATDTWTTLPPMPETREHCAAGAIGGKLYVGGGRTHSIPDFRPKTWEYDPVAMTYAEKEPIPTPRGGVAGAVLYDRLFVFGGEGNEATQSGVFDNVEAYDPATNTWQDYPAMDVPRHGLGAAVLGGKIYLPGGATTQGAGAVDANSVFFFE